MMRPGRTDVLIIGAGPVGLTLALLLAARGLQISVVEKRDAGVLPSPKCNHVSARSMEIFRSLGLTDGIRDLGLPEDYPHSISYRTTTVGEELTCIHIPCRRDRFSDRRGPDGNWPTPEPPHRVNQIYLEPFLFAQAEANSRISIFRRCELKGFSQTLDGVAAQVVNMIDATSFDLDASIMVGCDGGQSFVRKNIGARFEGDAVIQRVQSTYIDAPALIDHMEVPPAWAMFSLNPRRQGNVYAIDGKRSWLVHNYLKPEEEGFESVDRDAAIRSILGVGPAFSYDTISLEDWYGRRLVANRFRDRRVFICGDAAHIWVPYAGYGMNAGIADASNLAWVLGAYLEGWAPFEILNAYEAERHPVTDQVGRLAMQHSQKMQIQRLTIPENIEEDSPAGASAREKLGAEAYDLNVQQYACAGLNFGYIYRDSPVIHYDEEEPPVFSMGDFEPSTVPGARLPHFYLPDGSSVFDHLGKGFTLLCFSALSDRKSWIGAAEVRGLPLKTIDLAGLQFDGIFKHRFLIVRADGHIAWRGQYSPENHGKILDYLTARSE